MNCGIKKFSYSVLIKNKFYFDLDTYLPTYINLFDLLTYIDLLTFPGFFMYQKQKENKLIKFDIKSIEISGLFFGFFGWAQVLLEVFSIKSIYLPLKATTVRIYVMWKRKYFLWRK